MSDDLDALILRVLDGAADPGEEARLRERLLADPAVRERFAFLACQQQAFEDAIRAQRAEAAPRRSLRRRWLRADRPPAVGLVAGLAAAALVAVVLILASFDRSRPSPTAARKTPVPSVPRVEKAPPVEKAPAAPPRAPEAPAPVGAEDRPRVEEDLRRAVENPPSPRPPEPAVPPVPAPPVPAPARPPAETAVAVATLAELEGDVVGSRALRAGDALLEGDDLDVRAGRAVVVYADGTRVALEAGTALRGLSAREGKRVRIERGALRAEVARQPAGRPMVFESPHGEATVLGTTLRLTVAAETRLEVEEGRVRLKRLSDGRSVEVTAGHAAIAAPGLELAVRPLMKPVLQEDFARTKGLRDRWTEIPRGLPAVIADGVLDIDTSPRGVAPGQWQTPGGLRTRAAFKVPFEVTAEVSLGRAHDSVVAALLLKPPSVPPGEGDAVYGGRRVMHVCRRGNAVQLSVENVQVAEAARPLPAGQMERLTAAVDREMIRVLIDGQELIAHRHGLRMEEPYQIGLEASAKSNAPAGVRVRYRGVVVSSSEK